MEASGHGTMKALAPEAERPASSREDDELSPAWPDDLAGWTTAATDAASAPARRARKRRRTSDERDQDQYGNAVVAGTAVARGRPRPSLLDAAREAAALASEPLPHRDRIQASFGAHDLGAVRAVIGGTAGEVAGRHGANAFAVGNRIAFRAAPDLHLAAHEAAHVVQQRAGVVLDGGVGRPDDAYERQADAVADAVVAGRSAATILGPPTAGHAAPAVQMECGCGNCERCAPRDSHEAVQFGMGDVRVAEARMEAEAEATAGTRSGLARDQLEEKFYQLAETYSDYPFWKFSGPRDLGEWMDAHPGRINDFGGPWEFNVWVTRQTRQMHPVPLAQAINPGKLKAERASVYEGSQVRLEMNPFNYVTRAHRFWASRALSRGYLRFEWSGSSTAVSPPSFHPDSMNDWRCDMRVGKKGQYTAWVQIAVGGSTDAARRMTVSLDAPVTAFNRVEFETEFLRRTATEADVEGTEPMFTRGDDGVYVRKPEARPYTLDQQITTNLVKLGALKAWRQQGKLSEEDYKKAKEHFEKRNRILESLSLPSTQLYLMTGAFVGDEYPDAVPIRAVMANNLPNRGPSIRVVLKDTTLDPKVPTSHEGSAPKPEGAGVKTQDWVDAELRAIVDMGEHWRLNNDYPHGKVTLYVGSRLDQNVTFTITIPQQNWKKTLRKILAPIAIVGAVGAMLFGQVQIAVPLMVLGGAATLANVALGIEHRIKMGTFGWNHELLLDALTIVSTFMGFGILSQAFRAFSVAGKIYYLVGMGALDVAQGVLIGMTAKEQLDEARILYHGKLVLAKTEGDRQRVEREYKQQVSDIIGGAIAQGAFIAVSVASGARGVREVRAGGGVEVTPSKRGEEPGSTRVAEPTGRPEPHVEAARKKADFEAWESRLKDETRKKLASDPELRKRYEDMDPEVRRALTLCESPCIPDNPVPSPADVARIKAAMQKLGIPGEDFRLREYLHRNRGPKMKSAVDELAKAGNAAELNALYDRSIAAHASGGTAKKVGGEWVFTRKSDGGAVNEHAVGAHKDLKSTGTDNFFQSHHGIQDKWALDVGMPGYSREDCPTILLRDSHAGSPHQRVTAAQTGRGADRAKRTYADERLNLATDMARSDVPDAVTKKLLAESDAYFGGLYRNIESTLAAAGKPRILIDVELTKLFGTWKP